MVRGENEPPMGPTLLTFLLSRKQLNRREVKGSDIAVFCPLVVINGAPSGLITTNREVYDAHY